MLCSGMFNLMDFKVSEPINNLSFMPKVSEFVWPLLPEQLPPLILKPQQPTVNASNSTNKLTNNNNCMSPSKEFSLTANRSRPFSYEKNRMSKLVRQIEDFHFERSHPFIWMQNNFGKTITQKEFNKIYRELKEVLPPEKAPNRDVNRNQRLRYKWMNDVWDDAFSRNVLQQLITRAMVYNE